MIFFPAASRLCNVSARSVAHGTLLLLERAHPLDMVTVPDNELPDLAAEVRLVLA
jgi:hypothetical protein